MDEFSTNFLLFKTTELGQYRRLLQIACLPASSHVFTCSMSPFRVKWGYLISGKLIYQLRETDIWIHGGRATIPIQEKLSLEVPEGSDNTLFKKKKKRKILAGYMVRSWAQWEEEGMWPVYGSRTKSRASRTPQLDCLRKGFFKEI